MTPPKDKPEKNRRQKEKFTDEQNALIKKYFEKHVKETKAPSKTLCKQFLDTYPIVAAGVAGAWHADPLPQLIFDTT